MISTDKQYRTRNGRDARLVGVDNGWAFGFVGASRPCLWIAETGEVSSRFDDLGGSDTDLIEVKPKVTRTYWVLHDRDGSSRFFQVGETYGGGHPAEAYARLQVGRDKAVIAITGPHEITFTEGGGL